MQRAPTSLLSPRILYGSSLLLIIASILLHQRLELNSESRRPVTSAPLSSTLSSTLSTMKVALLVEPSPITYICGYANRFQALMRHLQQRNDRVLGGDAAFQDGEHGFADRHFDAVTQRDFVDGAGNVVVANIDITKDKAPPGTRFEGSKMHHFMRFSGGTGMHEGFLPGYPASHGCVRMPGHMAAIFYNNVTTGTPVTVRP